MDENSFVADTLEVKIDLPKPKKIQCKKLGTFGGYVVLEYHKKLKQVPFENLPDGFGKEKSFTFDEKVFNEFNDYFERG